MGEACCLRLMQADGMNDNLSGNPAMPPPTGTTVPDREGITAVTRLHSPQQEWKSQAATPLPSPQQERKSQQEPVCPSRSRNGNHKQPPLCPPRSRTGNHKQPPLCLLPKTTDIARQLSRLPWRYLCLYKGLSMMPPDRMPPQEAWRHERG